MKYELSHDTIAKQVYEKASVEARTRRKVERFVRERYEAYQQRDARLTQDDVDYVTPYLTQVNISKKEDEFIAYAKRQLATKRRNIRLLIIAVFAALLGLTTWAVINGQQAEANEERAKANALKARASANEAIAARRQDSLRAIDLGVALGQAEKATLEAISAKAADSLKAISLGLALNDANLQRITAERRALELQARSLAEVAAGLPREEKEVALRLAQMAYGMCSSPPPQVQQKIAEIFYRQLRSEKHVTEPLAIVNFVSQPNNRFCRAQYSPDRQYVLLKYSTNLALYRSNGQLLWVFPDVGQTWAIQFAPNSQWIAFSNQNKVEVFNVGQQHIATIEGHESSTRSIAFSPDSKRVVTCAMRDSVAKVWSLDGRFLFNLKGHHGRVNSSTFSSDGEFIATASEDQTAIIWDSTGQVVAQLPGHQEAVSSVQFSPNRSLLFTSSRGQPGKLWNIQGELLTTFDAKNNVDEVQFSPDGEQILTSDFDGDISLWDLEGNLLSTFNDCRGTINSLCFSLDGRLIGAASSDGRAKVWDVASKRLLVDLIHKDAVNSIQFLQNGQQVLTSSSDGTAKTWPLSPPLFVDLLKQGRISRPEFAPNGNSFITVGGSTARLWNRDGEPLLIMDDTRFAYFLPQTKRLFTYGFTTAFMRDLSGNPLVEWPNPDLEYFNDIVAAPNEQLFCSFYSRKTGESIRVFNDSGQVLSQWQAHEKKTTSVTFSPDNQMLLTLSLREEARLWDLRGQLLLQLQFDGQIKEAVFSPDGEYIVTYETYGPVKIWNLAGDLVFETPQSDNYRAIKFSPSGQYLAIIDKTTLTLWDIRSMSIKTQIPHAADIHSIQFSPDGQRILTTPGGHIAIWNLVGELIVEFKGHSGLNTRTVFAPDGDYILSTSDDETVKLWPLPQRIYNYLKNEAAIPELTAEQRKLYSID